MKKLLKSSLGTGILLAALCLVFYMFVLGDDLMVGDYSEFFLGSYTLGIVHHTGYPTYLIVGKIFMSLFPFHDPVWRLNLLSAIFGAFTILFLYLSCVELSYRKISSALGALTLAFSYYFFQQCGVSKIYTLHLFLTALLIFLTIRWLKTKKQRLFYFCVFLCGILLTNHASSIFIIASFFIVIILPNFFTDDRSISINYFIAFIFFIAGLLPYIYLPIRVLSPSAYINTDFVPQYEEIIRTKNPGVIFNWIFWYLGGGGHRSMWFGFPLKTLPWQILNYIQIFIRQFSPVGIIIAFLGLVLGFINLGKTPSYKRKTFIFIIIAFLLNLVCFMFLKDSSRDIFYLFTFLFSSFWLAEGFNFIFEKADSFFKKHQNRRSASGSNGGKVAFINTGLAILMLILPLYLLYTNFKFFYNNKRDACAATSNINTSKTFMEKLPKNSIIFFSLQDIAHIFFYQLIIGGVRPDIRIMTFSSLFPNKQKAGHNGEFEANELDRIVTLRNYLKEEIKKGEDIYFITIPIERKLGHCIIEQSFQIKETGLNFPLYLCFREIENIGVFQLLKHEPPVISEKPVFKPAESFNVGFKDTIAFNGAKISPIRVPWYKFYLLELDIQWQILRDIQQSSVLLELGLMDKGGNLILNMHHGLNSPFNTTHFLGAGHDGTLKRGAFMREKHYVFGTGLVPGVYRVTVSARDASTKNLIPLYFGSKDNNPGNILILGDIVLTGD